VKPLPNGTRRVQVTGKRKTFVRLLALNGAVQGIMLLFYMHAVCLVRGAQWRVAQRLQHRSYLRDGLCGAGTTYACPGPGVPINRPDSVHIDPSGQLVSHGEHGARP